MERLKTYYADKVILLTGGTGLVGRILLETMIRRLPEIRRIYVLIRPKVRPGGAVLSSEERLWQEIQGSEAFDLLRKQHGDAFPQMFLEKVKAVTGDLSQERMGLDEETYCRLQGEVQIIINCAAVVTFDAPIDAALNLNILGPQRVLEFARGSQYPVLAHVSTCYVNATRAGPILEAPLDPRQSLAQINGTSQKPYDVEEEVAAIRRWVEESRKSSLGVAEAEQRMAAKGMEWAHSRGWHDVYTFTKAMGEQMFVRHLGDVRSVIIRPAIIESIWLSPQPGWLNGFRMLDPLIVAYGKGRMPDFPGNAKGILDIIPADLVVNAMLAIIPKAHRGEGPLVYQIASGMQNPLTLQGFADLVDGYFRKYPLVSQSGAEGRGKPLKMPTFPSTKSFLRRLRYRYILPIRIGETLATAVAFLPWGRRLRTSYKAKSLALERLRQYGSLYGPYAETKSKFMTDNTKELWESLHPEDQRDFNFDISRLDWRNYIQEVYIPGVKRYLLGMPVKGPSPQEKPTQKVAVVEEGSKERAPAVVSREQPAQSLNLVESLLSDIPDSKELDQWTHSSLVDRAFRRIAWMPMSLALRYWLRLEREGLNHISLKGPFIVVPNHSSHLDTPAILRALDDEARNLYVAAAADYFFENRVLGWSVHAVFHAIPFDRQGPATDGLGLALGVLKRGHSLIFFPEASRTTSGKIQTFKSGIGVLALMSGAPVLPAHIKGTFQSLPKGHSFVKRHRVTVRFGPPLSVEPYLPQLDSMGMSEVCRAFSSDVQKAVEALNDTG